MNKAVYLYGLKVFFFVFIWFWYASKEKKGFQKSMNGFLNAHHTHTTA